MVDFGTHAAVYTNLDVILQAILPSVVDSTVDTAPVSSSHALSSNTTTLVVTGVARGSENMDVRPSTRTNSANETTNSVSDSRQLCLPKVPAERTVPSVAMPGKATSEKKVTSSSKSTHTWKKSSPVLGRVRIKQQSLAGVVTKASSLRSNSTSVAASTQV